MRDNGCHGITDRLLQVRQAGSQPLAQPVTGTGVASVTSLRPLIYERTSRRLSHGAVSGKDKAQAPRIIIYSSKYYY